MSIDPCKIRSPRDLVRILREVKQAVEIGTLHQVQLPQAMPFVEMSLDDIPAEGPWPDNVEMYFEETGTGAVYKLTVETYHGTGGSWVEFGK